MSKMLYNFFRKYNSDKPIIIASDSFMSWLAKNLQDFFDEKPLRKNS